MGEAGRFMRLDLAGLLAGAASVRRASAAHLPIAAKACAVAAIGLGAANCSAPSAVVSSRQRTLDPKYGVYASPRVVGENDVVPKGGGRTMVGHPYVVAGRTYVPRENPTGYVRDGTASWYGTAFHGRLTANGEVFDRYSIAAAHPTLPLPSYVRVTNLDNRRSMIVRVNDRGPYHSNRVMDVSQRVAEELDFKRVGTGRVRVEYLGRASTRGSDDEKLLATLRTDGRKAPFPAQSSILFAEAGDTAPSAWPSWFSREPAAADRQPAAKPDATPPLAIAASRTVVPTALAASVAQPEEPAPAGRVLAFAPLPPERPFDLVPTKATTPVPATAAAGAASADALPPRRPASARLAAGQRTASATPRGDAEPESRRVRLAQDRDLGSVTLRR